MDEDAIAEALNSIARALNSLSNTVYDVFGSADVGNALRRVGGGDALVADSLDNIATVIQEASTHSKP